MLLASHVWVLTSAGPKDVGVLRYGHGSPAWCGSSEPRTPDKSVPHCLTNWLPSCFAPWCLRLMFAFSLTVQARVCSVVGDEGSAAFKAIFSPDGQKPRKLGRHTTGQGNLGVGMREAEKGNVRPNSCVIVISVVSTLCAGLPFGQVAIYPSTPSLGGDEGVEVQGCLGKAGEWLEGRGFPCCTLPSWVGLPGEVTV